MKQKTFNIWFSISILLCILALLLFTSDKNLKIMHYKLELQIILFINLVIVILYGSFKDPKDQN